MHLAHPIYKKKSVYLDDADLGVILMAFTVIKRLYGIKNNKRLIDNVLINNMSPVIGIINAAFWSDKNHTINNE